MESLPKLKGEALQALESAQTAAELRDVEVEYLGRSGKLTAILRSLKDAPAEE